MERDALAGFQADLMELMLAGFEGERLREAIRSRHGEPWAEWVDGFDPRAERVAHLVLKKWTRRAG